MADVAVALRGLEPEIVDQLSVVFVTSDPATDTPAVLGEYLARYLPTRFVGLTGGQEAIDQAQLSAGVPLAEENGRLHSSMLLLYGTDDQARVAFDAGNTPGDIADDLRLVAGSRGGRSPGCSSSGWRCRPLPELIIVRVPVRPARPAVSRARGR